MRSQHTLSPRWRTSRERMENVTEAKDQTMRRDFGATAKRFIVVLS